VARPSRIRRTSVLRPGVVALLAAVLLLAPIGLPPVAATDAGAPFGPLLISEIHPDPRAVGDADGEWL